MTKIMQKVMKIKNCLTIAALVLMNACGQGGNTDFSASCATDILPTIGQEFWECKYYAPDNIEFSYASTFISFDDGNVSYMSVYDEEGMLVSDNEGAGTWTKTSCGAMDIANTDGSSLHLGTITALAKDEISALMDGVYVKCFKVE